MRRELNNLYCLIEENVIYDKLASGKLIEVEKKNSKRKKTRL